MREREREKIMCEIRGVCVCLYTGVCDNIVRVHVRVPPCVRNENEKWIWKKKCSA